MPKLKVSEDREIYYEVEGNGPPLVLLHPSGIASSIWHDIGYVSALESKHRLILIDALGFGRSTRSHEPEAYALDKHVADVVGVLEALNIPQADVFGYSKGGVFAISLAILAPKFVRRLIAGGACPPGMQPSPPPDYVRPVPLDRGPQSYFDAAVARWKSVGVELSEISKADLQVVDFEAIAARGIIPSPDFKDRLAEITIPTLFIVGAQDPYCETVKAASGIIPNCICKVLGGRSHISAFADKGAMVAALNQFLC